MIQLLKHEGIDKVKWDKAIAESHNASLYGCSWYLDTVSPGWQALVEDNYDSVMPLPIRKKYGITYMYQPNFTQQLGVFSKFPIDAKKVDQFLKHLPASIKYIDQNLSAYNLLTQQSFHPTTNQNFELDLSIPLTEIRRGYAENTRRNIRKADKNGLKLTKQVNPVDIITLFRTNRGKSISTLTNKSYHLLNTLIERSQNNTPTHLWGALLSSGELCAGMVLIEWQNRVYFIFSGSNATARKNGAMFFLINAFIEEHAEKALVFDFNGSNNNHLAKFYAGFGSTQVNYRQIHQNRLPKIIRWIKS